MKVKCLQHNRNIFLVDDLIFHIDKTPCWSRLLTTPYDNKEPDNEQEEGNPGSPAGGVPGVRGSGDQG